MNSDEEQNESNRAAKKPRVGIVVKSILAAAIGVQSDRNRRQDFEQGSPLMFIIGGVVFTLAFILTISMVVGFVLSRD